MTDDETHDSSPDAMSAESLPALTAPVLDQWLRSLPTHNVMPVGDQAVVDALIRIFATAEALESCGGDDARSFWAELGRGTYDDLTAMHDPEYDDVIDRQEWEDLYPSSTGWFRITLTRYQGQIGLTMNDHPVAVTPDEPSSAHRPNPWPDPWLRQVTAWLETATAHVVDAVRAGTYNDHVAVNLPYCKRLARYGGPTGGRSALAPASGTWAILQQMRSTVCTK